MSSSFRFPYSRGVSAAFLKKAASAQRAADVSLEVFDEKHNRYELKFPANVVPLKAKKGLREGIETAVFEDNADRISGRPLFVGQLGIQINTNALYRANSLTIGDWVLVTATSPNEVVVFADAAERALAAPLFIGQLGLQLDTNTLYRGDSLIPGDWSLVAAGGSTPTYVYDRQAGGGAGIRYYGFLRLDDSRWLIKLLVLSGGIVTETYANEGNNPLYATLDAAWPNRVGLVYEEYGDLIDV